MRTGLLFVLLGMVGGIGVATWWISASPNSRGPERDAGTTKVTQGPPVMTLVQMSELVTLRVNINETLEATNDWYKGAWVLAGDALIGTDCSQITVIGVNDDKRTFIMKVPTPRVISCRVDHNQTKKLYLNSVSWNPSQLIYGDKDAIIDEAMKQAQSKLERIAGSPNNIKAAKERASAEFERLCSQFGWKVSVSWFEAGNETSQKAASTAP